MPRSHVPRRALPLTAIAFACAGIAAGAAAGAERFEPANGRVLSGVAPEYGPENVAAFARATGQPSVAIYGRYTDHLAPFAPILEDIRRTRSAGLISWRMIAGSPTEPGGTLTSIARGDIDAYLVAQAAAARRHGRPLFVRPLWEMNGDWFTWSTYTSGGERRAGNSPAQFRRAWQRARIIFDGGRRAAVDRRLARLRMPGLRTSHARLPPARNVAWVWSLTKGGVKQPDKPHDTIDYYPGDAYVDWVGMTFHQYADKPLRFYTSQTSRAKDRLARADDIYAEFSVRRGKPFMLAEWAVASRPLGNGDNPRYVADMFAWIRARPMVKAQVYFDRVAGSTRHRLEDHPRSRARFASSVRASSPLYAVPRR
jgi:hypothetical protein